MMRLAAVIATRRGINVLAPVHDAFLIGASISDIEDAAAEMQRAMGDASEVLLGFRLRSDVKIWRHPERFTDKRGLETWRAVCRMLGLES